VEKSAQVIARIKDEGPEKSVSWGLEQKSEGIGR
jgi:hypothetical protein